MSEIESTEKETQKAILELLTLYKIFHWRNNSGAYKTASGGFVRFGFPGSPDIIAVLPPDGIFLGIEVKDEKKYLTPSQKEFKERLEESGGPFILARSVDDVIDFLSTYYKNIQKRYERR